MPSYTMRRTWPETNRNDDYVFRIDGRDAGRCYLTTAAHAQRVWLWTVYGTPRGGMEESLETAQRRFKDAAEEPKDWI